MATLDLHEQEQVDALRAWWKENGTWLLAALVIAAAAFAGMRIWQSWQAGKAAGAATLYAQVEQQMGSNDAKRIANAAQAVVDQYPSSAYASRAELLAAQASMHAKNSDQARMQLQWVIDNASEEGLQSVARLKLAALLLDEKKYEEALGLLASKHPAAFDALYADLKGDVLLAQGKKDEARVAYQAAFDKIDATNTYRNLIQMKLDSVGGAK